VTTSAARPAGDHQAELEVVSESEGESHITDRTRPEGPPPTRGVVRPAPPKLQEALALGSSGPPAAQPPCGSIGQDNDHGPRREEEEQGGQEGRQGGSGGPRRTTRHGWQPSATVGKAAAVPGFRLYKGACPRRLPDLPGYDAEGEAGPGPCLARGYCVYCKPAQGEWCLSNTPPSPLPQPPPWLNLRSFQRPRPKARMASV
jgi:hypothetical protein